MEDITVQPQSYQQHAGTSAKYLQNKHYVLGLLGKVLVVAEAIGVVSVRSC